MASWTNFTDEELALIKEKLHEKNEKSIIYALLIAPVIWLIVPYLPGRRGRPSMVERMDYQDAVLLVAVLFTGALLLVYIRNYIRANRTFKKDRIFFSRRQVVVRVKRKSRTWLKSFDNILETDHQDRLGKIEINKEQSTQIKVGDELDLEIEEYTNTVLHIR